MTTWCPKSPYNMPQSRSHGSFTQLQILSFNLTSSSYNWKFRNVLIHYRHTYITIHVHGTFPTQRYYKKTDCFLLALSYMSYISWHSDQISPHLLKSSHKNSFKPSKAFYWFSCMHLTVHCQGPAQHHRWIKGTWQQNVSYDKTPLPWLQRRHRWQE